MLFRYQEKETRLVAFHKNNNFDGTNAIKKGVEE